MVSTSVGRLKLRTEDPRSHCCWDPSGQIPMLLDAGPNRGHATDDATIQRCRFEAPGTKGLNSLPFGLRHRISL